MFLKKKYTKRPKEQLKYTATLIRGRKDNFDLG